MQRIRSLDILRGAIMVLMAIDHVRLYGGVPAGGPTADLFFTRWVTHFSAPGFAFLAGTSIFFLAKKLGNINKLSVFLLTRGLLFVLLEVTLIRFLWAFHVNWNQFFLAGVIWMLGWCMVIMALLVRFRAVTVGIIGLIIIAGQQAFHYLPQMFSQPFQTSFGKFWNFIYPSGIEMPENIAILYVIVPWIGVMAAGYGFGLIMQQEEKKRNKLCIQTGIACIVLFIAIGSIFILKNNDPQNTQPFIFKLLNQNKYPASQLFLLMTLGPLIALVPFAEKAKGWLANVLTIFGKVPMFYYLMHIILIHLSAFVVNFIRSGNIHQDWYGMAPFYTQQAEGIRWSLPLLYFIWIFDVAILYFVCKWYAKLKAQNQNSWMRFI
ncbi:MAG: heparan-alpha-glucosaminide N-acetyltransferase domain-containing protein [Ferruginibacter sp.]